MFCYLSLAFRMVYYKEGSSLSTCISSFHERSHEIGTPKMPIISSSVKRGAHSKDAGTSCFFFLTK